jgi:hypothetical protein
VRRMLDSIVAKCGVLLEKQSRRWCWTGWRFCGHI